MVVYGMYRQICLGKVYDGAIPGMWFGQGWKVLGWRGYYSHKILVLSCF